MEGDNKWALKKKNNYNEWKKTNRICFKPDAYLRIHGVTQSIDAGRGYSKNTQNTLRRWWDRAFMLDYGIVIEGCCRRLYLSFTLCVFYLALLSDHVCVRANLCVRIVVQSRSPFLPPLILFLGFHLPSLELSFDFGVTLRGQKKKRPWTLRATHRELEAKSVLCNLYLLVYMPPELVWV